MGNPRVVAAFNPIASRFAASRRGRSAVPLSAVQRQARDEFVQRLQAGAYRLTSHTCPCGNGGADVLVSEIDRYGLPLSSVVCLTCGIVRIDPHLDAGSLDHFYGHLYRDLYGRALDPSEYFARQRRVGEKLLATFGALRPGASVWEVGCGAGGTLAVFRERGHPILGNDLEAELLEFGRKRGIGELHLGAAETIAEARPDLRVDLIVLHHVLEHVGRPVELLACLRTRLAPGGRIVVIVPDLSRIDRYSFPAGDALLFFHVAHRYNYSPAGLDRMARLASLRTQPVEPVSGFPTAWSLAPELWLELKGEADAPPSTQRDGLDEAPAGQALLRYLQRTETNRRFGVCAGQRRRMAERFRFARVVSAIGQFRRGLLRRSRQARA